MFFSSSVPTYDYNLFFLDLMDYQDSDEDGTLATDGAAMLDDDKPEQGEGSSTTAMATVDWNGCSGHRPSNRSINSGAPSGQKGVGTGSSYMSFGS